MVRKLLMITLVLLPLASIGQEKVINIATSEYPPYEYLDNNEIVGVDTAIVEQVLHHMGYTPRIYMLPWARAEAGTRSGTYDMLYSLTYSESRAKHYYFTDPINTAEDVFFKLADKDFNWDSLDDLAGLKFGLSSAYSYAPVFMDWLRSGKGRVTMISHEQPELTGLRMVALGRIDLFICEKTVCEFILDTHEQSFPKLQTVDSINKTIGPSRGFRAAFSKQHPRGEELRDEFNAALDELDLGVTASLD